jgi:hypothetical protein
MKYSRILASAQCMRIPDNMNSCIKMSILYLLIFFNTPYHTIHLNISQYMDFSLGFNTGTLRLLDSKKLVDKNHLMLTEWCRFLLQHNSLHSGDLSPILTIVPRKDTSSKQKDSTFQVPWTSPELVT